MTRRSTIEGPLRDVRFVVDEYGRADGPTVVWLHGVWGELDGGPPVGDEVLDTARVLVVHLPGWGESEGVERFERLESLATGCWWLFDELGIGSVCLAGHGIGATLALELAIQQPARVTGLVGAAPFGLCDADDPGVDFFALLPKQLLPHLYVDAEGELVSRHFPPAADPHGKGLQAIRRVQVLGAASRYLFPLPDTGIASRLYRLAGVDTTLLFGAQDGLIPASTVARWGEVLPGAAVHVDDQAAHMLPYETASFAAALAAVLGRATATTGA